jgi:hypothetical protein
LRDRLVNWLSDAKNNLQADVPEMAQLIEAIDWLKTLEV